MSRCKEILSSICIEIETPPKVYKSISVLKTELFNLETSMNQLQDRATQIKSDLEKISREIQDIKIQLNIN